MSKESAGVVPRLDLNIVLQAMPPNADKIKLSLETAVVQQVLKSIVGEDILASLPPEGLTPEDMAVTDAAKQGRPN
jgi:hypothetical protein